MPTPTERRIELQYKLQEVLGSDHVYFRPPESIKLVYPCIVYRLDDGDVNYANNKAYIFKRRYDVQLIHKTADTELVEALIEAFPYIRFQNSFTYDNLMHENYILYY